MVNFGRGEAEAEASEGGRGAAGGELGDIIPGYLILDSASAFTLGPIPVNTPHWDRILCWLVCDTALL